MKTAIGISDKHRVKSSEFLGIVLANETILYMKTRKFHWNVSGESFMELHKMFEMQYKQMESSIDEIAERIGKLGQKTVGTLEEFLKLTTLKEAPGKYPASKQMILDLLQDHESIIGQIRDGIGEVSDKSKDLGTADFLTGLMEQHETTAWILRRYLD